MPTERNQGCNHMTCSRCRGEWCWMCRGDWKVNRFFFNILTSRHMENELEDTSLVIFMILLKQRKLMTSLQGSWRTTKGLRFTTRGLMIFAKHLTYLRYFNHESASKQLLQKKENLVSEAGRMAIFLHVSYDSVPEAIDLVVEVLCKLIISDGNSAVIFSNLHMFMVFSCPQILRRKNSSNIYKVAINNIQTSHNCS